MKIFLVKVTLQIGVKRLFCTKKVKSIVRTYVISDLNSEENVRMFYERNNCKRQVKQSLELKK